MRQINKPAEMNLHLQVDWPIMTNVCFHLMHNNVMAQYFYAPRRLICLPRAQVSV